MTVVDPVDPAAVVPDAIVHGLAGELNMPEEEVARVYRDELESLAEKARVRSFLQVLTIRRVRQRLATRR